MTKRLLIGTMESNCREGFERSRYGLTLRYYGVKRIAAAIAEDIALAEYLGEVVAAAEDFEVMAPR